MHKDMLTALRSGCSFHRAPKRAWFAFGLAAALLACGEDITQPRSADGALRPALELASEGGPRILMGTIPPGPDFTVSTAYGIEVNDAGQAAGLALVYRSGPLSNGVSSNRAAFWSAETKMVEVPLTYGTNCLDDGSIAAAINASGRVVGFGDNCDRGQRGFSWALGEPAVELATPEGGWSAAFDINKNGVIAGTVGGPTDGTIHGAIWTDPLTLIPLPDLPGHRAHEATGINDNGDVAGYATADDGVSTTVVVWPSTGGVVPLPLPEGWQRYDIVRINERGLVVGGASTPLGERRAFLWNPLCGGLIDIGPGAAYAVDRNGRVVGEHDGGAFVWTAESGQVPLSLFRAYGLSDAGHVVGETLEEGAVMTRVDFSNPNGTPLGGAAGPYVLNEGSSVVLGDPPAPNPHGYPVCYKWDFGGGVTAQTPTVTRTFDDDATVAFTVTATDAQANTATLASTIVVNNVAPTATFTAPATVDEGTDFTLALNNAFDPSSADMADLLFAFDCGRAAGYGEFRQRNTRTCAAPNDDTRLVRGKVTDQDGGTTEYSASVVILNVAPTVAIDANQPQVVAKNTAFTVTFSFTDPGVRDRWSYHVDFGHPDCAPVAHAFNDLPALAQGTSYSASCPKGYPSAKQAYTVTVVVTVRDNDGGSTAVRLPVTVTK